MNFTDIAAHPRFMNVIDDMFAQLFDKINDGLLDLNVKVYGLVGNIFGFAMNTNGDGTAFAQYHPGTLISQHPAEFFGGSAWTVIETLSNNVIVPIAAFMLMIVLVTDLVQILISGNQFQEANPVTIMKWFMKAIIGLVIVSNVYHIASGIFTLGTSAGRVSLAEVGAALSESVVLNQTNVESWQTGYLILMLIFGLITMLLVFALFLVLSAVLAGRIIEVFMYMSVAPLTAATFMNSEWKTVGYGWVKGILALAFQGFFVVVALAVFSGIFGNLFHGLDSDHGITDFLLGIGMLNAYLVALMFTVIRSGSISKTIFNAH